MNSHNSQQSLSCVAGDGRRGVAKGPDPGFTVTPNLISNAGTPDETSRISCAYNVLCTVYHSFISYTASSAFALPLRLRCLVSGEEKQQQQQQQGPLAFLKHTTTPAHLQIAPDLSIIRQWNRVLAQARRRLPQQCSRAVSHGHTSIRRKAPTSYATRHVASFRPSHDAFLRCPLLINR